MNELPVSYFFSVAFFLFLVAFIVYLLWTRRANALVDRPTWNNNAIGAFAGAPFVIVIPTILGIVALVQISRSGDRGRGLAIAALVIQGIVLLGFVGFLAIPHHSAGKP